LDTILFIILILIVISVVPKWPYSRHWGYGPSSIAALVLVLVLFLGLLGHM
jgi:hypothetical protein